VYALPRGARKDFWGANFSDNTKNNIANGARGTKMIFPSGWGVGFNIN